VLGKENVGINAVEPVGQYAVKLVFDDGTTPGSTPGNTCTSSAVTGREVGAVPERKARARPDLGGRLERAASRQKKRADSDARPLRAQDPLNGGDSAHRCRKNATTIAPSGTRCPID